MIDEQNEVRRINWNEVFSFTHIFKGFKMAIQPSKMLLALAVIVLIYIWGAWVLDTVWSWGDGRVAPGEVASQVTSRAPDFEKGLQQWREGRLDRARDLRGDMGVELVSLGAFHDKVKALSSAQFKDAFKEALDKEPKGAAPATIAQLTQSGQSMSSLLKDAQWDLNEAMKKAGRLIDVAAGAAAEKIKNDTALNEKGKEKEKEKAQAALDDSYAQALRHITVMRVALGKQVEAVRGQGVFAALMDYERDCVVNAVRAVRYGNITGGLARYRAMLVGRGVPTQDDLVRRGEAAEAGAAAAREGNLQTPPGDVQPPEQCGLIYWKLMALHGLLWMVQEHWIYATLLGVFSLAVWALFGGAIFRVAALHAAREEKISASQALKFAFSKFFSFFCAPLVPAVIILGVGLLMSLVALAFGNIPWAGSILIGLPFVLAIVGGMIIAFITVGLVGGGALMYPTIAVEGSDSFDAISRSFSYIFARPWRAILYALVMTFYGVITFLFVRLFAWIALAATHVFVKLGIVTGGQTLASNADKLDLLWPAPTMERLAGEPNWAAITSSGDKFGAILIWVWVALIAAATLAYLISFCASGTTIIYYLLRRKVDATDLDDVYVEEAEEPAGGVSDQPAPATPSAQAPAAPTAPAAPVAPVAPPAPAPAEPPKPPEPGPEKKD